MISLHKSPCGPGHPTDPTITRETFLLMIYMVRKPGAGWSYDNSMEVEESSYIDTCIVYIYV
jgi:hypothetical protein